VEEGSGDTADDRSVSATCWSLKPGAGNGSWEAEQHHRRPKTVAARVAKRNVGNELPCSLVKQWRAKIRKEGHNGILGSINMHPLNLFDGLNFILLYSMVYIMIFHLKKIK
jgi:hypothetical protein